MAAEALTAAVPAAGVDVEVMMSPAAELLLCHFARGTLKSTVVNPNLTVHWHVSGEARLMKNDWKWPEIVAENELLLQQ